MSDPKPKKDPWDKVSVMLHPLGGLLTAVAVAAVGLRGSQVIERRQSIDTNARLYSELMSRREEAESSLRKDMFVSIIQTFLRPNATDLDSKVLNLELLAYNFHESLNLKPLFLDLQRKLDAAPGAERSDYAERVYRVAREIVARQLFALEGHGKSFRRTVDFGALHAGGAAGVELDPESIVLGERACDVLLRVLGADEERQQLRVRLETRAPNGGANTIDTRATFDVGYFDFPMIDNTRLANGLRCAVTLSTFSSKVGAADLTTVCFPGEYASLKDRPYYDEVIQKLQQAAASERTAQH
ncbi:MAG TPA: hypothetical protein VJS92_17560 [Candidatus Polarisedimenticolaceae bacterium]|nr:hypothetical protein [Candidatus Polarisedimenticolaceae bacterium]